MLLLRDERDLLAQRLERQVDEADAADVDAADARRVDAREQTPERRLAGARRADDRHALARLQVEVDAVQHVAVRDVGVAHVLRDQVLVVGCLVGRRAVGRHAGDADEPRERRRADLDLVEPRDQPVDGVGELHDVERDRRHLAERRVPVRDEPAAPGERGRDGEDVGELGRREPDRAQVERAPLGPVGLAQVGVDPPDALLVQAERLERAATLDRLADGAGERRVRGALPQVALRARASGTSACRTRAPARRRCTAARRAG